MTAPMPPATDEYDRTIRGVFGKFGAGMGLRVCFIQAGIAATDLENVALVGEIPGSDRWPVRDLFQRDVDHDRVTNGLLPWLQDETKVKFFNPLTLTLLPIHPETESIAHAVPTMADKQFTDAGGQRWRSLNNEPFYRFCWLADQDRNYYEYGRVDWSSRHVRLVAIDGQHRVSALKRFAKDSGGPARDSLFEWSIPVVITGLEQIVGQEATPASILDVVRNMFVYINTQARIPTQSRQILLNDEHISYLCTQETLEHSHRNDTEPDRDKRVDTRLPLLFFDWRGETQDSREVHSPAALKSIVEIAEWMKHYILGTDIDEESADVFGVQNEDDPLWSAFQSHIIGPAEAQLIRRRFCSHLLPGISHLFENFEPYRGYISSVRDLEESWESRSDRSRHALSRLRFGNDSEDISDAAAVNAEYEELVEQLLELKLRIPYLLAHDIGMRGVVYAFGMLRSWHLYWTSSDASTPWLTFSEWFVRQLNRAYRDGWFGNFGSSHRRFVTNNANDHITNYRIEDAEKGLGAFLVLVLCSYAFRSQECVDQEILDEVWEQFAETTLGNTLRSGYKSYHRSRIRGDHPTWSIQKIKSETDTLANRAVHKHLEKFRKALDNVEP